jgi:hypothetical protein
MTAQVDRRRKTTRNPNFNDLVMTKRRQIPASMLPLEGLAFTSADQSGEEGSDLSDQTASQH